MRLKSIALCLLLIAVTSGCTSLELTPVTKSPTGQFQQGQIIWHDYISADISRSKAFYGDLFGWTFEQKGDYAVVFNHGVPIGGMVELKPEGDRKRSGGWLSYMSMRDIEDTAAWVAASGGKVLKGPEEMKGRGEYAMIAGPQDEPLILLDAKYGDPPAETAPLNSWLWLELWTNDVEKALDFYQSLGEYSAQRTSEGDDEEYWVLVDTSEKWQGGITVSPFIDLPTQWVPILRVAEPASIVSRVIELGGRVIIKPDHPLTDGRIAMIEDPMGGIFMVESWEEANSDQEQVQ